MAQLITAAGNIITKPRTTICCICGGDSTHDVCNSCHTRNPDGSVDQELVEELVAADIAEQKRERLLAA